MEGTLGDPAVVAPPPIYVAPPRRKGVIRAVVAFVAVPLVLIGVYVLWTVLSGGRGSYAFLETAPGGNPVTWDHCAAIRYQVNPEGAPDDWRTMVEAAFDDISENSGFVFLDAGETRNRNLAGTYTPGSIRGEPVLIIWSSQGRLHSLQGDTVGLGGGAGVDVNGTRRLVTGIIALDAESHSRTYDPLSTRTQRLVLEHEIGHVLGLDHVDDQRQLMNAAYVGQDELGPGDLAGLRKLHDVPCG
jgi:Matrixin